MSPGVTFERVYRELKRRIADGALRPGQPIEPAAMSAELAASITPIRDALHRLVGEQLVEAPNHNGFRVPRLSEAELRDLYLWNGRVLMLAIRRLRANPPGAVAAPWPVRESSTTAYLFLELAQAAGSEAHLRAVERLNDRLAPYRRVEPRVCNGDEEERDAIRQLFRAKDGARLNRALLRYHQRRAKAVSAILAALATGH